MDITNDQPENPLVGFIMGMSRSGTTWLSQCLNNHSQLAVFGETGFWGKHYIDKPVYSPDDSRFALTKMLGIQCESLQQLDIRPADVLRNVIADIERAQLDLAPRDVFLNVCHAISETAQKKWVIEKTPHHVNWLDRIDQNYKEKRFIVLYRDPYDFMLSYKHQGDRMEVGAKKRFHAMYHPVGCSIVYKNYVQAILEAKKKYPEQVLMINYKRIKSEPESVLSEVQQFLRLEREDISIKKTVNTSFPSGVKPELAPEDLFWLKTIAGDEIKKLGFTPPKSSNALGPILRSITDLPLWAIAVFRHLYAYQAGSVFKYLHRWVIKPN